MMNEMRFHTQYLLVEVAFTVVPTDNICGQSLSSDHPVDMNSIFMKLYVT